MAWSIYQMMEDQEVELLVINLQGNNGPDALHSLATTYIVKSKVGGIWASEGRIADWRCDISCSSNTAAVQFEGYVELAMQTGTQEPNDFSAGSAELFLLADSKCRSS